MNIKNARIQKLWDQGIRDPQIIARKLGLLDTSRVIEGLKFLKLLPLELTQNSQEQK